MQILKFQNENSLTARYTLVFCLCDRDLGQNLKMVLVLLDFGYAALFQDFRHEFPKSGTWDSRLR